MKYLLALVVLLAAGLLFWSRFDAALDSPRPSIPTAPQPVEFLSAPLPPPLETHPFSADLGPAPDLDPHDEPRRVFVMLDAWRRATGRFPVAEDNAGLMRQLTARSGNRPPLLPPDHPRLNARGELLDPWDTPYFFHHIAAQHLEVRSAGPDRTFYTDDDIVAAPARPQTATGPTLP